MNILTKNYTIQGVHWNKLMFGSTIMVHLLISLMQQLKFRRTQLLLFYYDSRQKISKKKTKKFKLLLYINVIESTKIFVFWNS